MKPMEREESIDWKAVARATGKSGNLTVEDGRASFKTHPKTDSSVLTLTEH